MNFRSILTYTMLVAAVGLIGWQLVRLLDRPDIWPPDDFVEYWCAGRLNLTGGDPYDAAQMYALEQSIGWDIGQAVMMWNPPWTLCVAMPLGYFPHRTAQVLWLIAKLGLFCGSAHLLSRVYRFGAPLNWLPWLLVLGFFPSLVVLHVGQIGPFFLAGAVGFLWCLARGYPALAGAACVLIAIKPHLAYLLWFAIGLQAIVERRLAIIVGGIVAGVLATLWPLWENPLVFQQYFRSYAANPPSQWMSPTGGTLLRVIFGEQYFRLQFVPMIPGVLWFARHWYNNATTWNWTEETPRLLLVSFATAPYGAWQYDLVLLLVPIVALASKVFAVPNLAAARAFVFGGVAINLGLVAVNLSGVTSVWFAWAAPTILVWDCWVRSRLVRA